MNASEIVPPLIIPVAARYNGVSFRIWGTLHASHKEGLSALGSRCRGRRSNVKSEDGNVRADEQSRTSDGVGTTGLSITTQLS